jgi:hypothetical protein
LTTKCGVETGGCVCVWCVACVLVRARLPAELWLEDVDVAAVDELAGDVAVAVVAVDAAAGDERVLEDVP